MSLFLQRLKNIAIVLVRPKYPENIGFVARVACNMGLSTLVLVCDKRPDMERVRTTATHNAGDLVGSIKYHTNLFDALSEFHLAIGTTARKGRDRQVTLLPHEIAGVLAPLLAENRVAVVFGPEDRGLINEELQLCSFVTCIPTADFTSLNLSHAVAIFCHEIFKGVQAHTGSGEDASFSPRLATMREMESVFTDIGTLFAQMDEESGNEKMKKRLVKMRTLLGRRTLQAKETRFLSEICRELGTLIDEQ